MKWAVAIEAGAIERGQQGTRDRNGKMAKEGDLIRRGKGGRQKNAGGG